MLSPKKVHGADNMKLYTAGNCTSSYQTRVTRSGKGHVHAVWYHFVKILARGIIFYLISEVG